MKIIIIALVIVTLLLLLRFVIAGQLSKKEQAPGVINGQLLPCPDKPNCINTEYPESTAHYMPPLDYPAAKTDLLMSLAKNTILEMGGKIINEDNNYLSATFTSRVFRFVDDFEIKINSSTQKLHIRSASRVGHSDFGINKKRVKNFSHLFKAKIDERKNPL
ncbi:MAG: DUF1499 domain-containing protein [Gammaproteobacteria bacterium]|nr:DUF1499 domain-containing protein [Gammaproteobacteria bacterium]